MSSRSIPGAGSAVLLVEGQWRLFSDPVDTLVAREPPDVPRCIRRVQDSVVGKGLHAAGFISYEAAPGFDPALRVRRSPDLPLAWFGVYRRVDTVEVDVPATAPYSLDWRPSLGWEEYELALRRIKERIRSGLTYQVNYTWRLRAAFRVDPWDYFSRLAARGGGGYGAYLDTGRWVVCSASPELFFRLQGGAFLARPMKGTSRRGSTPAEDETRARDLEASPKDRAENIMIVDMVRNDVGRVAEIGTVHVPRLCEVERFPTVLQMTSTVAARVSRPLDEVMGALFPCASITGAPKASTMGIIAELESTPRGIYTGSIGCVSPDGEGGMAAHFNVAIRTVTVDRDARQAEYGVGGGILWESDAAEEYRECEVKMRVLQV